MDSSIFQKYLDQALHFLSYRPRSEKEVRDNLVTKKAPRDIIEQIINWLKKQRFLNDEEFTEWWIGQRARFRPKGIRIIKLELRQKGIPQEIIDSVIQNDLDSAKKIVEKKLLKYKGMEKRIIYQKLGTHLARRGFDWETIKRSIDEIAESP